MNYTQVLGDATELRCMLKFIEMGYECSVPYGNGAKYDFIADINGKLLRIQCKTCKLVKNQQGKAITFSTVCSTTNTKITTRHKYDETQIDYFATYFEGNVYLVPVTECSTMKTLRFTPPQNGNQSYCKAEDYLVENIIPKSQELIDSQIFFENLQQQQQQSISKSSEPLKCKECGIVITKYSKSGLCPACKAKASRLVERPSRGELKNMIRNCSFTKIAQKYGVSDNAIKKWCKAENLPSLKSNIKSYSDDEWEKI